MSPRGQHLVVLWTRRIGAVRDRKSDFTHARFPSLNDPRVEHTRGRRARRTPTSSSFISQVSALPVDPGPRVRGSIGGARVAYEEQLSSYARAFEGRDECRASAESAAGILLLRPSAPRIVEAEKMPIAASFGHAAGKLEGIAWVRRQSSLNVQSEFAIARGATPHRKCRSSLESRR